MFNVKDKKNDSIILVIMGLFLFKHCLNILEIGLIIPFYLF